MAESGKITREDIIAKDAFTSAVDEAKELLKVVTDIQNALKTKAKQSTDGFAIASPQTLDDVAKLTKQIDDLKKQIIALESVTEKQKKAQKQLTQAQAEENIERKKNTQAIKEAAILGSNLTTSYEKQVARLAQIKRELKSLSVEGVKAPKELKKEFDKLDDSVRKAEKSVGENQRSVGKYKDVAKGLLSSVGIGLGIGSIVAGLKGGLDTIREFESSIANLSAITGLQGQFLKELEGDVVALSITYGQSAKDIADAVTIVGSKAPELLKNKDALLSVTDSALLLSKAGKIDVPVAAEAITKALNKFDIPAQNAGKVVDILAAASKEGSVEVGELSEQLSKFGGIAKNSGLDLQQSAAIIEAVGKTVDESGIKIRGVLIRLASGADEYNPKIVGLKTALSNLAKDGFDDTAAAAKKFGLENAEAAIQLIKNREEVDRLTAAVDINGVAIEQATTNMNTIDGALGRLGAAWDAMILNFSEGDGILRKAIDGIAELVNVLARNSDFDKAVDKLSKIGVNKDALDTFKISVNQTFELLKSIGKISGANIYEQSIGGLGALADAQGRIFIDLQKQIAEAEKADNFKYQSDKNVEFLKARYEIEKNNLKLLVEQINALKTANKKAEDEKLNDSLNANKETKKDKIKTIKEIKEVQINDAEETQKTIDDIAYAEYEVNKKAYEDSVELAEKEAKDELDITAELLADTEKLFIDDGEKEKARLQKLADDKLAQERKVQQQVLQGIEQGTKRRSEIVQNGLNAEIQKQDEAVQRQQELAAKGLDNTLAYQEKKREELQVKLAREKEAERRREEALQLAGAFLGSYQSRLDDKQSTTQAMAGALADTLIAKAISSTIAGAFAGGVEDFQGKGTGTSDSNLIAFSHGESVVTAKATQQYSGLVTAMNKGLVDDYVKQMILPDMDAPMKVNGNSFQSAAIIYTLNTKLDSLEKAIKNKQEVKVNWNAQGERVEEIVKDGMKTVIKHVTTGKRRL
jgi:TP901 family phage tail tape measure protein